MKNIKEYVNYQKEAICELLIKYEEIPSFLILQVGDVEASNRYVRNKMKDCEEVGIHPILEKFNEDCSEEDIINKIVYYNTNPIKGYKLSGIMLQLPIPEHLNLDKIIDVIPSELDVDGFKKDSICNPCTPKGIIDYLDYCNFDFEGKNAVVIGRSNIVGKPIAKMLLDRNCTVTICHSKTKDLQKYLSYADLVIVAAGKRGVMNSQEALLAKIVDVGINFENGKLYGDVIVDPIDKDRVTPVPGGVGLLTRLALLENIVSVFLK